MNLFSVCNKKETWFSWDLFSLVGPCQGKIFFPASWRYQISTQAYVAVHSISCLLCIVWPASKYSPETIAKDFMVANIWEWFMNFCTYNFCFYPFLQGSRWTYQATRMDGKVGGLEIKPDQMQLLNPLLSLILSLVFETVIYPLFSR